MDTRLIVYLLIFFAFPFIILAVKMSKAAKSGSIKGTWRYRRAQSILPRSMREKMDGSFGRGGGNPKPLKPWQHMAFIAAAFVVALLGLFGLLIYFTLSGPGQ